MPGFSTPSIITAGMAPGSTRSDTGTYPGVGRDGKAITAAIVPAILQRTFDLGAEYLALERARLLERSANSDPRPSVVGRKSIQRLPPRTSDAAPAPTAAGPPLLQREYFGLSVAQIAGGLALIAALVYVSRKG